MNDKNKMDERMHDGLPFFITMCRLSFESVYNIEGKFPPALFIDEQTLIRWADSRQLNIKRLGDISLEDAKVITWTDGVANVQYEGVWARSDWNGYRSAMIEHSKSAATEQTALALKTLDADHVINRANIENTFGTDWKKTWVYLFPASSGVNRSFGSNVEKIRISYTCGTDKIRLAPIHLLKMFVADGPSNPAELETAIEQIRNQIVLADNEVKERLLSEIASQYSQARFGKTKVSIDDYGRMTNVDPM